MCLSNTDSLVTGAYMLTKITANVEEWRKVGAELGEKRQEPKTKMKEQRRGK